MAITDQQIIETLQKSGLSDMATTFEKNRAIQATDIGNTQQVSVPTPTATSSAQSIDQIASEVQANQLKAQKELDTSKKSFQNRIDEITGVMGSRERLEQEAGLDQAQLDVSDIRSQIEARELAFRRQVEATQKTAGLSGTQIARQVSALSRDASRELADLSIIESARLRRFDSISTNIDRKIKSQLEPLQFQLQFDQMFYQENRALLTDAQNKAFQIKLAIEERNYQEAVKEKESIKNIALQAAQFGATGEQIKTITDAKTFNEALNAGGSFLGEPFRMQVEAQKFAQKIQREQLNISYAQLDIQRQAQKEAANQAILMMDREARKEVEGTQAYQNWEMRALIANDTDNTLREFAGTENRDNVNWDALAKSDSAVNAIATQLVYSRNPQLRRASELGDANATADIKAQVAQTIKSITVGRNIQPTLLADRVREIDTNYRSSVDAYNKVVNNTLERNPGAILPEYNIAPVRDGTVTKTLDSLIEESKPVQTQGYLTNLWNSLFNK
jgi:hypothetical protein